MKLPMKSLTAWLLLAAALAGCGKNDEAAPVPTEAAPEAKHEDNLVTLTKEQLANVKLKSEPARLASLGMTLKAAGRISANLNQTAKVTPTLEGRLTKLNFDVNDTVKAGSVVALMESPELLGKPLELKAPIDGVITERNATVGELADKGRVIYTLSDPARLWAIAEVKERDIAAVKLGQAATFTTLAFPGEPFRGQVVLINNQVEGGARTVEVRIAVDNADGRLKPGMFADVEIVTTILDNVLLIPETALQTEGGSQIVFVAQGGSKFEKRVVQQGLEQSGQVQILDGIKAGEQVVTEGSFILKSEMLKGQLGEE